MKNNVAVQICYRSIFLALAFFALVFNIGILQLGEFSVENIRPFFFTDFFNWVIIMAIVSYVAALVENTRAASNGTQHAFVKSFPLLRFCTAGSMLFAFLLGAFFVYRVGNDRLIDLEGYGNIYPGIFTAGYWLNASVLLSRFVLPVMYFVGFIIFDERMKTRGIYSTLAILPPTIFYFFDLFFGMIMSAAVGGTDALIENNLYGIAYPYFFQDSALTYTGWWWMLIWPTIFGVSLVALNNVTFIISRIYRTEDGKLKLDRKTPPDEDAMCDCLHPICLKMAAKKKAKQVNASNDSSEIKGDSKLIEKESDSTDNSTDNNEIKQESGNDESNGENKKE